MTVLKKTSKAAVFATIVLTIGLLGASCQKGGEPVIQSKTAALIIATMFKDSLDLEVRVNQQTLAPTDIKYFYYVKNQVPLTVFDKVSRRVLLDTIYDIQTIIGTRYTTLGLYQATPGTVPVFIHPPATEPVPPEDQIKVSVMYTFDNFPDSVRAVIENKTGNNASPYAVTDELMLYKNKFSRFFLTRKVVNRCRIKIYRPGINGVQLGVVSENDITESRQFGMYIFTKQENPVNGVVPLRVTQFY